MQVTFPVYVTIKNAPSVERARELVEGMLRSEKILNISWTISQPITGLGGVERARELVEGMMQSESLNATALRELDSARCVCGTEKKRGSSFCRTCFYALPKGLRNRLYLPMSGGYVGVYDEAKDYLRIETDRLSIPPKEAL